MIREDFTVQPIKKEECKPWLLDKHYARRIPSISYAFGLYDKTKTLVGICTYGSPCRYYNDGEFIFNNQYTIKTLELNRLVINEALPKNTLSFFISKTFKFLPSPICLVSYSDNSKGHHGYIYQATNWIYTGLSEIHDSEYIINGKEVHSRTLTGRGITAPKEWALNNNVERTQSNKKHRYFMFLGSKKEQKTMQKNFRFNYLSYPKGDNQRYDASAEIITQAVLF